ncbi:MAG: General secretion pathway protein G [Candidatus Woesebacteria bacterium GW2011_GWA2_40_7]|uniref:General secretion pathway protein G n=3 Tax=Candidatus Woeseibacteriota TaxID=1752722 RepID=A0A0G0UUZ0_9BACT|nr:MAG: General secretion pathway protein G [Candidatus Woesebacteria bacterium GW2011_GWB1_39_10]KKR73014.1 MAG: General secretion pathway protein G [Candidatus Woesebacteria bacterium GW2011_GWA2_40_7]KKR92579.1 MAG: General secretion pathway protein G [Candidatus Woesebacteria bacterium GW2011_GWA1_41_13b]
MYKLARGFTLIELLVVISIIGILATLVSANLNSARSRARDAARKSDIRSIATALRLYYNDKNTYPVDGYFDSLWGSSWTDSGVTYMSKLPGDPLTSQTHKYEVGTDGNSYILSACLENASDTQGVSAAAAPYDAWCPTTKWMFQIEQ